MFSSTAFYVDCFEVGSLTELAVHISALLADKKDLRICSSSLSNAGVTDMNAQPCLEFYMDGTESNLGTPACRKSVLPI